MGWLNDFIGKFDKRKPVGGEPLTPAPTEEESRSELGKAIDSLSDRAKRGSEAAKRKAQVEAIGSLVPGHVSSIMSGSIHETLLKSIKETVLKYKGQEIPQETPCIHCNHSAEIHLGMTTYCGAPSCDCRDYVPDMKATVKLVPKGPDLNAIQTEIKDYLEEFEVPTT